MNANNLWLGIILWLIVFGIIKGLSMIDNYLSNKKRINTFAKADRKQWGI
jgi:hypothetical protein